VHRAIAHELGNENSFLDLLGTNSYGSFLISKHLLCIQVIRSDFPGCLIGCDSDHSLVFGQLVI